MAAAVLRLAGLALTASAGIADARRAGVQYASVACCWARLTEYVLTAVEAWLACVVGAGAAPASAGAAGVMTDMPSPKIPAGIRMRDARGKVLVPRVLIR